MKARERGRVRSKGMLIAMGVNLEGHREILGFQVGDGESYESWTEFLGRLKIRGLEEVDFVVSDNHGGLVKAIREKFCDAVWQRCQTHFSRNLLDKIPKKYRSLIHPRSRDMYDSPDKESACHRKDIPLELLEKISPQAHRILDETFSDVMAVLALPSRYRKLLRTSNSIERLNEEIRRREQVIRIFPNEASITRLIGALLLGQHERWISGKAYFSMGDYLCEKSGRTPAINWLGDLPYHRTYRSVYGGSKLYFAIA